VTHHYWAGFPSPTLVPLEVFALVCQLLEALILCIHLLLQFGREQSSVASPALEI
jgi:hypothetical protein